MGTGEGWLLLCTLWLEGKSKESTVPLPSTNELMKKWNVLQRVRIYPFLILMLVQELVFLPRVYQTLRAHSQPAHHLGSSTILLAQENPCQRPLLTTLIHSTKAKHTFSRNQQHKREDPTWKDKDPRENR